MAAATNSANKKRTGPGGPVSANISGYNCIETTHRDGRQQRRPFQVCQTSQISYQVQVGPRFPIQLSSASTERFNDTSCNKAITFRSCKYIPLVAGRQQYYYSNTLSSLAKVIYQHDGPYE